MHPETGPYQKPSSDDLFVFQFFPATITIDYTPNYAEKQIPGASHPLYQWISGGGRSITFQAQFVSEVGRGIQDQLLRAAPALPAASGGLATPSSRYQVDVNAAVSRIQSLMMPTYGGAGANAGLAQAPPRVVLYFPGMGIGGGTPNDGYDEVHTILRAAPITVQKCHPNGSIKIAEVSFQFSEVVQRSVDNGSAIRYIDRTLYETRGKSYRASIGTQRTAAAYLGVG